MMNLINLATTDLRDRSIDLYILDHAKQNKKYFDALVKTDIFHKVTFLHTKTMTGGNSARLTVTRVPDPSPIPVRCSMMLSRS